MPNIPYPTQKAVLIQLRNQIKDLKDQVKELETRYKNCQVQMIESMREEGLTSLAFDDANVIITNRSVAQLDDWESFIEYVFNERADHLIQRRVGSNAIVESVSNGLVIPGTSVQTVQNLTIRQS